MEKRFVGRGSILGGAAAFTWTALEGFTELADLSGVTSSVWHMTFQMMVSVIVGGGKYWLRVVACDLEQFNPSSKAW